MEFKIALIQMLIVNNKKSNIANAEMKIREAVKNDANVIVLPEMFTSPFHTDYFPLYAEEYPGETSQKLSKLANELNVYIIGGSIPERVGESIYNTSYSYGPDGNLLGKHRKVHLFDVDVEGGISIKESDVISSGNEYTLFDTEFGKIGVAICYDMRFPELIRKMTLKGAEIVIIPAAFNMTTGPAHWHITARARALDNQVYMVLTSPARDEDGVYTAYGHSLITNPWGAIEGELGNCEGILYGNIDIDYLKKVRRELPLLKHRRPDLYGTEE